jgi:amidohydrolase
MTGMLADQVAEMAGDLVAWRRDFHRHPEVAFEERRTAGVVRAFLERVGIEVRPCGEPGLRGVLKGGRPGPTVALRADMDALPLAEENDHGFASEVPGAMHACGHDGHMAILMGAARWLAARRDELEGSVVFLFQPSEERPPGGAMGMVRDGALEGVDRVFGLHLWQPLPTGLVGVCPGPMLAQSDNFEVVVAGRGGHASQPHMLADPVLAAAQLVVAAQSIVSRAVDPLDAAVVSFSTIHGGQAHNIIPDEVRLTGTVRTYEAGAQQVIKRRLRDVAEAISAGAGATARLTYEDGYPPVVNDPGVTERVAAAARRELGDDRVQRIRPVMGGEDFAYYLREVPGAFVFLGMGDGCPYPHHNARFDLDERALPLGVRLMVSVALELMRD